MPGVKKIAPASQRSAKGKAPGRFPVYRMLTDWIRHPIHHAQYQIDAGWLEKSKKT